MTTETKTKELFPDFSTDDKRQKFMQQMINRSSDRWSDPLPNLKWLTDEEFARSRFFSGPHAWEFIAQLGGPNKGDNHKQFPSGYPQDEFWHSRYVRCLVNGDMTGFVLMSNNRRFWFGEFAFCEHKHQTGRNLGRCYNEYTCRECGYSYTVDSSD